jgi:hypothetical protein
MRVCCHFLRLAGKVRLAKSRVSYRYYKYGALSLNRLIPRFAALWFSGSPVFLSTLSVISHLGMCNVLISYILYSSPKSSSFSFTGTPLFLDTVGFIPNHLFIYIYNANPPTNMAPSAIFEPVGSFESLITTSKLEELKKSVLRKEPEEKSWPAYMDTPLSWKGPLFSSETEYTYTLSDEEIIEIDRALYLFKGSKIWD